MITLIHGDDTVSSRTYYKSIQKPSGETFDGEKLTISAIEEVLQSTGLFGDEKEIYIENFFSKRKASKEMELIVHALNQTIDHTTIVFWEGKEVTKKNTDQLKNAHVKIFTLPKSLFSFIDSIKPHNTIQMVSLYQQTLHHTDAEMVLVMLIRQIRLLLALSDDVSDPIEEVKRMAPWQQKKLVTQLRHFSKQQLEALHTTLFHIEVKSKTGTLPLPLPQTIDFFLSTI